MQSGDYLAIWLMLGCMGFLWMSDHYDFYRKYFGAKDSTNTFALSCLFGLTGIPIVCVAVFTAGVILWAFVMTPVWIYRDYKNHTTETHDHLKKIHNFWG